MDLLPLFDKFGDNPIGFLILAVAAVLILMATGVLRFSRAGAAQIEAAMGQLGTTSAALLSSKDEQIHLERAKGEQAAKIVDLEAKNQRLNERIETLEAQVKILARDAGRVDFLEGRVRELQTSHDDLQKELDAERQKSGRMEALYQESQKRLNEVQEKLNTLSAKTTGETEAIRIKEHGDML